MSPSLFFPAWPSFFLALFCVLFQISFLHSSSAPFPTCPLLVSISVSFCLYLFLSTGPVCPSVNNYRSILTVVFTMPCSPFPTPSLPLPLLMFHFLNLGTSCTLFILVCLAILFFSPLHIKLSFAFALSSSVGRPICFEPLCTSFSYWKSRHLERERDIGSVLISHHISAIWYWQTGYWRKKLHWAEMCNVFFMAAGI